MCAAKGDRHSSRHVTPDGKPDLQGYWQGSPTSDAVDYSLEGVSESDPEMKRPIMPWEPGRL